MSITPLVEATDATRYGGKAVQLGVALRAGLPVPDGLAIPWDVVDACVNDGASTLATLRSAALPGPYAVRSSAVGEDSAGASFAGTHLSVLGVRGADAVLQAVRAVRASAQDAGALAYRSRLGLVEQLRMGVVVQRLVDADVAGVMFTRNPVTGADERIIEASWGLGEAVVAGLVTPDRYVLDASGRLTAQTTGEKDLAIRRAPEGGTVAETVASALVELPCLDASHLAALHELAFACDRAFGSTAHDIEFAFADGALLLLQRRPITGA